MASGESLEVSLRTNRVRHRPAKGRELLVSVAGKDQHGARDLGQAFPQRSLNPGSGVAEAGRHPLRTVLAALRSAGLGRVQAGEQRARQPLVEKSLDSDGHQSIGQPLVGGPALLTFGVVDDPRGGADENESLNQLGLPKREVKGGPTAHRVPEIGGPPTHVRQQFGRPPKVGIIVTGTPVPGGIDKDHFVLVGKQFPKRTPAPAVLGETVTKHQSGALAVTVVPQGPRVVSLCPTLTVHLQRMPEPTGGRATSATDE